MVEVLTSCVNTLAPLPHVGRAETTAGPVGLKDPLQLKIPLKKIKSHISIFSFFDYVRKIPMWPENGFDVILHLLLIEMYEYVN